MDIILRRAQHFADNYFMDGVAQYEELLNPAKREANSFNNPMDKIKYLSFLLVRNNKYYAEHKLECKDPEHCRYNFGYENISYYLTQELNSLGIHFNDDTFTEKEKDQADEKLDQILKDLNDIKLGQQVIYEDLTNEINELREVYFLGKKKWYQLFIGKTIDMVAGEL